MLSVVTCNRWLGELIAFYLTVNFLQVFKSDVCKRYQNVFLISHKTSKINYISYALASIVSLIKKTNTPSTKAGQIIYTLPKHAKTILQPDKPEVKKEISTTGSTEGDS